MAAPVSTLYGALDERNSSHPQIVVATLCACTYISYIHVQCTILCSYTSVMAAIDWKMHVLISLPWQKFLLYHSYQFKWISRLKGIIHYLCQNVHCTSEEDGWVTLYTSRPFGMC